MSPGDDQTTTSVHWTSPLYLTSTVKWTTTVSGRWLVEGGWSTIKLCRRRCDADASRPDTRRACPVVRGDSPSRRRLQGRADGRLGANAAPGYGWPLGARTWVNPSPNAPNLWMARCYPGSVMLEATTLSEGRGTTRPLELLGAPDLDVRALLAEMRSLAGQWMGGCQLRPCWFEPTFHKHAGQLCAGVQVHVEDAAYYDHEGFRPWRLFALAFKALRRLRPDYEIWRDFAYEYEQYVICTGACR